MLIVILNKLLLIKLEFLQNSDTYPLVGIVEASTPAARTLIYQAINVLFASSVGKVQPETLSQFLDCALWLDTKALQIFTRLRKHFCNENDLIAVLTELDKCFVAELTEFVECVRVRAVQNVDKFCY